VLAGFRAAHGARVAFADADGSTSPDSLVRLVGRLDDADVAIGTRHAAGSLILRQQPVRRRVLSRAFNLAARTLFGLRFRDTQCGAKALRADVARRLAGEVREREWAFDLDLILAARRLGYRVVEEPVTWSDADGSQLKAGSIAPEILRSLARLWRRERALGRLATGVPRVADPAGAGSGGRPRASRILALNWRDPHHPEAGGAELNLFEQARRWVRAGHEVTVVSARRGGTTVLPRTADIDGITVRRMGGRFSVYLLAAWYLVTQASKFDRILDVANGIPFFVPLFTRRPMALLVHHVHARQWFAEFGRPIGAIGWMIERFVVPLVYRGKSTIAVSPTTRDALLATGFRDDRVHIVYNGVTSTEVTDEETRPNVIAYVGRIKRYKRLDLLVRALPAIREAVPGARLVIAGDGDAVPELQALVAELGLGDAVRFLGFVDEATKDRLLSAATVFATPSMHEGWGLSVIEANSQGTPAVAYDVPGLRSAIRHGETGLLARTDEAFRLALIAILSDEALRDRLADGARAWAARFDWDASARRTLSILQAPDVRAATAAHAGPPALHRYRDDADERVAAR
jgi:glycosyltransferase involved in cell wall biosynthesis